MRAFTENAVALAIAATLSGAALAQGTAATVQRDANQQQRIEQGLQSGQLSTGEAARLERQETHVERLQANALSDGTVKPAEQARIDRAQQAVGAQIYQDKHNGTLGNPNSPSSRRMQADVQRNANQQARIAQGARTGQLSHTEVAALERGQAHVTAREARAGADGHVGPVAQANIQAAENRQSAHIATRKHNAVTRP